VSAYPDQRTLAKEKFDVIITLCRKNPGVEISAFCHDHVYYPISDSVHSPGLVPDVDYPVGYALSALLAEKKVLVHCYLGRSRSWLVASLVYALFTGCNNKQAWYTAKRIDPGAFKNPAFEEYMLK
jgi:protein-tyrosine phosphatase